MTIFIVVLQSTNKKEFTSAGALLCGINSSFFTIHLVTTMLCSHHCAKSGKFYFGSGSLLLTKLFDNTDILI